MLGLISGLVKCMKLEASMHIFDCVLVFAALAAISTAQLTDQNPNCPRMAQGGGCEQADVMKYCPKSCKAVLGKSKLLETLKTTVEGLVLNLTRVEAQKQQQETSLKQLQGELSKLKAENQGQNAKTKALESKAQGLEIKAKGLETEVTSLKTTGAANTAEISRLKNSLPTDDNPNCPIMAEDGKCTVPDVKKYCRKSCDPTQLQLLQAQRCCAGNTKLIQTLRTDHQNSVTEVTKVKNDVTSAQTAIREAAKDRVKISKSITGVESQVTKVTNDLISTETAIQDAAKELVKIASESQACCTNADRKITNLENSLQTSETGVQKEVTQMKKDLISAQNSIQDAVKERANISTSLTGVETEVTKVKSDLTSAQTAIQSAVTDRASISKASQACCTKADQRITALKNTLQKSITGVESQVTKVTNDLTSTQTAIQDAAKDRVKIASASHACCTNADRKITNLGNSLQTSETGVQNEITQMKKDLTSAQTAIQDASKERANISTSVTGFETEVTKVKSDLTSAQTAIQSAVTDRASISTWLSRLQQEANDLRTNVSSNTDGVNGAIKGRATISLMLGSVQRGMTQMKSNINSAQKDIVDATKSRATIETELSAVKKWCADNSNNLATMKQSYLSRLQATEAFVSQLKIVQKSHEGRLDSLTQGVQQLASASTSKQELSTMISLTMQNNIKVKLNEMQQSFVNNTELCGNVDKCPTPVVQPIIYPFDCCEVHRLYGPGKGVFKIRGHPAGPTNVYCEDGYTVLMRRTDDDLSFNRPLEELATALGKPGDKNFWIGLDAMHYLTFNRPYKLLVEVTELATRQTLKRAMYSQFSVGSMVDDYTLNLKGNCTGNGCDGFDKAPTGTRFSSKDHDVDTHSSGNCADYFRGAGFWYTRCGSSLTAPFCGYQPTSDDECALWRGGYVQSEYISSASMLITAMDP